MLKFNSNHKFKIMQITDIQELPSISQDTLNLLNDSLEKEKPDLVVLTGDQIKGYGITYKNDEDVKNTIRKIMEPITNRDIPFAVTFGNHDMQAGISNERQFEEIYKALPNCIAGENTFNAGTYNIPIYSNDGKSIVSNIYLIDSGTDKKGGGYEAVTKEQIEWYKGVRDEINTPSIVFQHIPLCEYYNMLKKVSKFTRNRIRAYRSHKNEYYILPENATGSLLEPPSIPDENAGEFDAFCEKNDIIAIFVGHDHKNDFVGEYKGITMGFTPSAGFNEYGNGLNRGVRIIELDEKSPTAFETRILRYNELGYSKLQKPVKDFIYRHSPATMDEAKIMIKYGLGFVAIITVLLCMVFC